MAKKRLLQSLQLDGADIVIFVISYISVIRFDEISPFWQYFKSLRRLFVGAYLVLGNNSNLFWSTIYAIGQIFIVANGLI